MSITSYIKDSLFPEKIDYVLGFFITSDDKVLVIRKERPDYQKGKLNGVGGKIEKGEKPIDEMIREFREESNIVTDHDEWEHYSTLKWYSERLSKPSKIYVFRNFTHETSDEIDISNPPTDEKLEWIDLDERIPDDIMVNLKYLIPLAQHYPENVKPVILRT